MKNIRREFLSLRALFKPQLSLILILILAAGCSSAPTAVLVIPATLTSSPIPNSTATLTPSPLPPTATQTPSATAFVPKATIKIFSLSPLSGSFDADGTDIRRGAELAVKQLAEPLMSLGYKVELVSYDDQSEARAAVAASKQIVEDPDILCGVGPFASRTLNEAKEIYHQAGLAFISPSATAAFATASGYPEVNRVVGRHDGQGAAGAQFAKANGFSRVFVISQSENYAQFNAYHFQNEAGRLGVEVVGDMITDTTKQFGPLIDRILAADTDLIYFSTLDAKQAGAFFQEARAKGYQGAFLGNEGIADPTLLEFVGQRLITGGGMYYTSIAAPASSYPGAAGFLDDFKKLYSGNTPRIFAAQAYDAAGICMRAIENASIAKGGELPTRAEVANGIRALQDYDGITGVFNFDKNGDPNPAKYFVFQVVSTEPLFWDQNKLIASFEVTPPE